MTTSYSFLSCARVSCFANDSAQANEVRAEALSEQNNLLELECTCIELIVRTLLCNELLV